MNNPKLLLHVFSTFGIGGPEVRTCDLINHFGERFRHTILAMDGNYDCRTKLNPESPVTFIEITNYRQNLMRNVRQFSRLLNQIKPDLLLTYNWGATEWGLANIMLRKCPHLHWEDGFGPDEVKAQKSRRVIARKLFLAAAKRIIVPSRVLERMAKRVWKFPASRVTYIPNGVDINEYARDGSPSTDSELIPESGKREKSLIVGTVATLRKEKNIPRLIRVFLAATTEIEAVLVIVGGGPEYETLVQYIEDNSLTEKVLLLGHRDIPSVFVKQFDVFAISSDTEQMPISVLEAMASGCPIAGTDVGDVKDMVAQSNQPFICAVTDEAAFTSNLSRLLADAELRAQLGQENLLKCKKEFDKQLMYRNYETLFEAYLK